MSIDPKTCRRDTLAVHAGQEVDPATGSVAPPLYQTSTFAFADCAEGERRFAGEGEGFVYTRVGNPTVARLEEAVAALEGGAHAVATASGMAALGTCLFALLESGDHVLATNPLAGPSRVLLERDFARFAVGSTFLDTSDLAAVEAAVTPSTRLLLIESPANPTLALTDLAAAAELAHAHGALLLVDNTFAGPMLQRPIEHGADLVVDSLTASVNGHDDVGGGAIVSADEALAGRLRSTHRVLGACADPHQAWLVLRGLRTLAMRVRTAQDGAQRIAAFLDVHEQVEWIGYPGLAKHPKHELAMRQMDGPGTLISFEVKGGAEGCARFLEGLRLITLAASFGGVETLIQHPATMSHSGIPRAERLKAGISDGLIRLSVGCEDSDDLIADLTQALEGV